MKAGAIAAIVAAALAFPASADIYMAGDAAVCDYPAALYPQQGWGQALAEFMIDPARLHNLALDGCSAKRYKEGGHWRKLADAVGEGDFVIVSFGPGGIREVHGGREAALREYESLLAGFVADVRAKGAAPILATPVPHSGGFSVEDFRIKVDGVVRRVVHDAIRGICICGFLKCEVTVFSPFKACIYVICETLKGFVSAFIGVERASIENWDGWQLDGSPIVKEYKEVN